MNGWKLKLSLALNFLVLAVLLNSIGSVALQAQRTFGISESAAGMLAVCKGMGIVAVSLAIAPILASIGYRNAMVVSLAGLAAVCALVPSAHSFLALKLLFAAAGAGFGAIKVAAYATVGLIAATRKAHASFMSFLESFFTFGIVGGYFLFGAFADETPSAPTAWLRVFYVIAALAGVALVLLLGTRFDESRVRSGSAPAQRVGLSSLAALARQPAVLLFGGCLFLYVMVEQSAVNWLPTFNHAVLHFPARLSIEMAGILTASMGLGRVVAGFALRRIPWFPLVAFCLAAAACLLPLSLIFVDDIAGRQVTGWTNVPLSACVLPFVGFFIAPVYPIINSVVLSSLPLDQQGAMSGLSVIFSALGSSIGTVATGFLFAAVGGKAASGFSLLPLAGLFVLLWFYRTQCDKIVPSLPDL